MVKLSVAAFIKHEIRLYIYFLQENKKNYCGLSWYVVFITILIKSAVKPPALAVGRMSTDPHHLSRYALRIFGCFGNARVGLFNEIDAGYFWKGAKDVWVKT